MWLIQLEMCWKYKYTQDVKDLVWKTRKNVKYLVTCILINIDIFWILSQQKKLLYKKETKMSSSSYNYIASLSCNLLLSTYISQLNEKEKFIIATWIKKELKDVKKIYSIKSFIKTSIIYTPHMFLLILSYFYKILKWF